MVTPTMYSNMTQEEILSGKMTVITKISLQVLVSICFCFFLFFISLILHIFFTTPNIQEHARYILFVHMLVNDALYLADGLFLFMASLNFVYLPFPVCYIATCLAAITFRITPYNLAAMALERYAAICFPLRHATLCSLQRSNYAIAIIWFIGLIPNIIDFIIMCASVDLKVFTLSILCTQEYITVNLAQSLLKTSFLIVSLVSVGLIIAFTYIRVMCITKNMRSSNGSTTKAKKTVTLHAVQFLLCLFSLTYTLFEARFRNYFLPTVNFLIFTFLPRFLSPLIYGLRDQLLSKRMRNL